MRRLIRSPISAALALAFTAAAAIPSLAQTLAQARMQTMPMQAAPAQVAPVPSIPVQTTAPVPRTLVNRTSSDVTRQAGPGLPPVDANQTIRGTSNTQLFQVLGFSGQIAAPVNADYNADNTYQTFAGQPGRGSTAILAESMDGSP